MVSEETRIKPNDTLVQLRSALRKYRLTGMHGDATPGRDSWRDDFDFVVHFALSGGGTFNLPMKGITRNGFTDAADVLPAKLVKVQSGNDFWSPPHHHYTEAYRPLRGHWHLSGCEQPRLRSAIEGLPSDASLSWEVYLDAGNAPIHVEKKIHIDHLVLHAKWKRGEKELAREFLIDVWCGAHNCSRFGKGG